MSRLESSAGKKEKQSTEQSAPLDNAIGPLDRLWSATSKEEKKSPRLKKQPRKQVTPLARCRATPNPAVKMAPIVIEIDDESVGELIKTEASIVPEPLPTKKQPEAMAAS